MACCSYSKMAPSFIKNLLRLTNQVVFSRADLF